MTRDAMEQRLEELESENAKLTSDLSVVSAHRDRLVKEIAQMREMLNASATLAQAVRRG